MFLNFLKNIFLKNALNKSIVNVTFDSSSTKIKTIGIIIDEDTFIDRALLLQSFSEHFLQSDINVLLFKNTIKKAELFDLPFFSLKDCSWNGTFEKQEVNDFVNQKFDLLVNYFDDNIPALALLSMQSKAVFKVGFASVDKSLNHFMINTSLENYKSFVSELVKYLKILNKI
jgi:hypothetical protein